MKIKIAVCIPAFSNAENIKKCIDSVFKSNANIYDLTILLYNNSSKQEIIDLCKEYAFEFNNIQLHDIRYNKGCSITWNDAIEYVYFFNPNVFSSLIILNDDIEFLDDGFLKFVEVVLKNPKTPVVTGDGYSIFSYSRFAYEKIGYFDENIRPAYFEDADFATRITKSGFDEVDIRVGHNHLGSVSIPENNLREEFESIHLPRTKKYYHAKWDNPIIYNGFPVRFDRPFNRIEERFRITYWERKRPHPFFTNIKEPLFAFDRFEEMKKNKSDINEHLEEIFNHTKGCNIAVSLGLGKGDAAFSLLLGCQHHISIDSNPSDDTINFLRDYFGNKSSIIRQSTDLPIDIEEFDVLFIDSKHTAENVKNELKAHAHKVNNYIIFHDTSIYGEIGENGEVGIMISIIEFLNNNSKWKIIYQANHNNGLIILGK